MDNLGKSGDAGGGDAGGGDAGGGDAGGGVDAILWSNGSDWLLDEDPPERDRAEIQTDPHGEQLLDKSGNPVIAYKQLKPLTLREELFVREYCKTFDAKKTANKLNSKTSVIHGFLQRKHVRAEVHKRATQLAKACDIDQQWVLRNVREIVERCMDEDKFDPSCALRGLEMVGKTFAMFTDKIEKSQTTVIRIESNIPRISDQVMENRKMEVIDV